MGAWTETLQTAGDALEDAVAGMVRSAAAHLLAHSRAPTRAAAHLAGRGPAHSGQRLAGHSAASTGARLAATAPLAAACLRRGDPTAARLATPLSTAHRRHVELGATRLRCVDLPAVPHRQPSLACQPSSLVCTVSA